MRVECPVAGATVQLTYWTPQAAYRHVAVALTPVLVSTLDGVPCARKFRACQRGNGVACMPSVLLPLQLCNCGIRYYMQLTGTSQRPWHRYWSAHWTVYRALGSSGHVRGVTGLHARQVPCCRCIGAIDVSDTTSSRQVRRSGLDTGIRLHTGRLTVR